MTRIFRWAGTLLLTLSLVSAPATAQVDPTLTGLPLRTQIDGKELIETLAKDGRKVIPLNDVFTALGGGGMNDASYVSAARRTGVDVTPFEAVPFTGLSAPTEYTDFIAMIDGMVLPGGATKANIGTASDGSTPIYSYTVGTGKKAALLVAGQHSVEPVGQLAAIRFFQWFETSTHPMAARLRASYKLILVANANPWAFKQSGGGRLNFNGVNLNRNWDFFWSNYDNAGDATNAKGSAAASESETRAIMALFDANDIRVVIDHHNMGASSMPTDLSVGSPSAWVLSNRTMVDGAMAAWTQATGGTVQQMGVDFDGEPQLLNWASYYMTVVKGVRNAMTAIIESNSNLQGGTERVLTDAGANRYCNMILSLLREHMENGHRADRALPYRTFMFRANPDTTTSVSTGGTLIDNTTAAPIAFDNVYGINLAGGKRTFRDVPSPTAGLFKVNVTGYLESSGTTSQRVDLALVVNGTQSSTFTTSVTVPATAGERIPFSLTGYVQIAAAPDAKTLPRLAANIFKNGANNSNPKLLRAFMEIEWMPNSGTAPVPAVPAPQ